jgi:hypothetical protein
MDVQNVFLNADNKERGTQRTRIFGDSTNKQKYITLIHIKFANIRVQEYFLNNAVLKLRRKMEANILKVFLRHL